MRSLSPKWAFLVFYALVVLLKLALVAHNEIISIQDDSAVYADQSLRTWALGYPEGYPLWLTFCRVFDVPQRIAIELLYLLAALSVACAARKLAGNIAACVVFVLLAFSSSTFFLFDLGLADGYFTCLTLFAISFTIQGLLARGKWASAAWALALGGVMGVMAITRSEDPLLAWWLLLLAVVSAVQRRGKAVPFLRWEVWREPLRAVVIAALTASSIVCTLCLSYYFADGVFARGVALIPGHVKLLENLARIKTGNPQIRFIPISRRARELAYAVSPTFAKYRPLIENPADSWQVISRQFGIAEGEIGGGWIWHAINTKVIPACGGHPALAEAEYEKMNAEIEAAFRTGKLNRRFIIQPLIGGNPAGLLRELPPSITAVVASMFSSSPDNARDQAFNAPLFDKAFVRRAALVPHPVEVTIQGWAFVNRPAHRILNLSIGSHSVGNAQVVAQERPDVVKVFGLQNGWKPAVAGFHADLMSRTPDEVKITYFLDDGSVLESDHLQASHTTKLENKEKPGDDVLQGIDVAGVQGEPPRPEARHEAEIALLRVSQKRIGRRAAVAVVALAILVACGRFFIGRDLRAKPYIVLFAFLLLLECARILFYSVLDARAWPGNQIRYLAPAHALWLVTIAISIGILFDFAVDRGRALSAKRPERA